MHVAGTSPPRHVGFRHDVLRTGSVAAVTRGMFQIWVRLALLVVPSSSGGMQASRSYKIVIVCTRVALEKSLVVKRSRLGCADQYQYLVHSPRSAEDGENLSDYVQITLQLLLPDMRRKFAGLGGLQLLQG